MIQDLSPDSEMRLGFLANGAHRNQTTYVRGIIVSFHKHQNGGFPGGAVEQNLSADSGDTSSIPDLGRSHMPWSN